MNVAIVVLKNFGNKISDKSFNKKFWKEKMFRNIIWKQKTRSQHYEQKIKIKKHASQKTFLRKINIPIWIKFGNKILEEKIMIKTPKNKNIGDKLLFLNSLERNFGRKKIAEQNF